MQFALCNRRPAARRCQARYEARKKGRNERLGQMTLKARCQLGLLFYTTLNIVVFTVAVYAVSIFPPLQKDAGFWLAVFTIGSLIVTAPIAWCVGGCRMPEAWRKKVVAEPSPLAGEPTRSV
jgi:hypothetical protein